MPTAEKTTGAGAVISYDKDNDGNWVDLPCVLTFTPPPRERSRNDATCLGDAVETNVLGLESVSDFTFDTLFHPGSTTDLVLQEVFNRDACDDDKSMGWRITYPHCNTPTATFLGQIVSLVPGPVTRTDLISYTVTVERTSNIS